MNLRRSKLIGALGVRTGAAKIYRWGLDLKRGFLRMSDKSSKTPKALVLVYHRVADLPSDPLELAVSPKHFEEQLTWLKTAFDIISLPELVQRIRNKALKGNEVAITFDDGYKDNLTHALPIAKKLNVPMTIFVTTGIFSNALPFPWDDLYSNTKASYLSDKDTQKLSEESLVTLGAHTKNHPRLSDLGTNAQEDEIAGSKKILENVTGKPIEYFAYPFGDYPDFNRSTVLTVKKAGYLAAFSNVQRTTSERNDIFKIPRILARNWSAQEMKDKLNYSQPKR